MNPIDVKSRRIIIILVSIVMFMEFLDTTIINTAIPSIAKNFNVDPLLLKYSVTSYFLSLAIFTPISGWCADKLGTKKIFIFSVSLFVIASLFCGLSKNIMELTCFRFFQGMGGAFMNPVSRIIILRIVEPKELVKVQGYIFTPAMLGFVLGPFLGGAITTYLNWSWIFFINIPVGMSVLYFAFYYIPQQKEQSNGRFDTLGFILSAISLGCLSFSLDMIGHYEFISKFNVIVIGALGACLFCILILHCIRKKNPVLDFLLFKIKTFRVGLFSNLTMYMVTASVSFLLPLMFQEQYSYSPVYSGMLVLPIAIGQLLFRLIAPKIIHSLGFKHSMCLSSSFIILSLLLLTQINLETPHLIIILIEFLLGSSIVIYASSTGALNYIDVPKTLSSRATSLDLTSRQFAAGLGIGLSALFLNFFREIFSLNLSSAGGIKIFHLTFIFVAFLGLLSFLQALQLTKNEGGHALVRR